MSLRPAKRRRRVKTDPMHEDDVEALDAVTVERVIVDSKKGPVETKKYVPLPERETSQTDGRFAEHIRPTEEIDNTCHMDIDNHIGESDVPAGKSKVRNSAHITIAKV
jgi:hypothetical protein